MLAARGGGYSFALVYYCQRAASGSGARRCTAAASRAVARQYEHGRWGAASLDAAAPPTFGEHPHAPSPRPSPQAAVDAMHDANRAIKKKVTASNLAFADKAVAKAVSEEAKKGGAGAAGAGADTAALESPRKRRKA